MNDYADVSSDNQAQELKMLLQARQKSAKTATKITEDTVVYCEDCGTQIPIARLKAVPTATRCIRCQTEYESQR